MKIEHPAVRRVLTWCSLVALGAVAGLAQQAAPAEAAAAEWTISARSVPIPQGASEELQRAIESAPAPDVEARRAQFPRTEEQWLAAKQARPNGSLEDLGKQLGVTIGKSEIEGVAVYRVAPGEPATRFADHLFLHVHGGAYVFGGGDAAVGEAAIITAHIGMEALSVDYRMPPEHPFPAAIEDVVSVYRHLLESRPAGSIVIGGTSAGGGLALASVHRFKALGLELPGAIYAGTPWADLTKTGDTLYTNEGLDRILVTYDGMLGAAARLYAGDHDLTDPLLSPVYGDFAGFPPTYLVTGTRDMFLSDTARTHRKLRSAGAVADLNVFEAVSHADYLVLPRSPEGLEAIEGLGEFLAQHLP